MSGDMDFTYGGGLSTVTTLSYLKIKSSLLLAGSSYTVKISATDGFSSGSQGKNNIK